MSTDNTLHGRSSTGSSDSTGPSQDPEEDSIPQSTEHLRHDTSSSWETRCTANCQDYLVSRCHITCQEVSDFSSKGSLRWRMTISLLEIRPSNPAQLLCIAWCISDDWNTTTKKLPLFYRNATQEIKNFFASTILLFWGGGRRQNYDSSVLLFKSNSIFY